MTWPAELFLAGIAWVGHACLWTLALNAAYSRPIPKLVLRPFRLLCGVIIAGFPAVAYLRGTPVVDGYLIARLFSGTPVVDGYLVACLVMGGLIFPAVTASRLLRQPPATVAAVESRFVGYWQRLGRAALGGGRNRWMARLPFTDTFTVEFTTLTLRPAGLPPAWDGLSILMLTDLHFHGTPSRAFFDALFADIRALPTPDVILLVGDFLDTDRHHSWIGELLGPLAATAGRYALLGNHDLYHDPDRVRRELTAAGYTDVGRAPHRTEIRGVPCAIVGHEGPWFPGPAGVEALPADLPRLGLSHTPDNFRWAQRHGVQLLACGHVHGGQIRLPVIGPIFVPSLYSRRYDSGVFQAGPTTMVVGRGVSGKETLRFRCPPQVLRLVLQTPGATA